MTPERRPLDLTNPGTARAVAARAGLHTKKRLGQHLLVDRGALESLVDALELSAGDTVLEIGPGIGTLTVELARRAGRVVAVELDEACVRALRITLRDAGNVEVVHGDALSVDYGAHGIGTDWIAAGNLPYNLTGALLGRIFESPHPPRRGVFLVQREVAARLSAASGDWSLATVAIRSIAEVERLRDVPPGAFDPPPRVHSSVIRMRPAAVLTAEARSAVLEVARAAFQMRRKTLRHGLTHAAGGEEARAMEALGRSGVDPSRRPGTLDLEEWRRLAIALTDPDAMP